MKKLEWLQIQIKKSEASFSENSFKTPIFDQIYKNKNQEESTKLKDQIINECFDFASKNIL